MEFILLAIVGAVLIVWAIKYPDHEPIGKSKLDEFFDDIHDRFKKIFA